MPTKLPKGLRARDRIRTISRLNTDPDILVAEDVARILRCDVDTVRRIPRVKLPARKGPGRANLYFREDVLSYVRGLPFPGMVEDDLAASPVLLHPLRGRRNDLPSLPEVVLDPVLLRKKLKGGRRA